MVHDSVQFMSYRQDGRLVGFKSGNSNLDKIIYFYNVNLNNLKQNDRHKIDNTNLIHLVITEHCMKIHTGHTLTILLKAAVSSHS